jgi:peptidoglycan hydrolase FlgJ
MDGVKKLPPRRQVDPQIAAAAQGMEAMFLDYMMKVMRQTIPKSEMSLDSPATEIYRGMLDSEIADTAARTQGVGLADQIIDYLDSARYTEIRNRRPPGTGGTHEGK